MGGQLATKTAAKLDFRAPGLPRSSVQRNRNSFELIGRLETDGDSLERLRNMGAHE